MPRYAIINGSAVENVVIADTPPVRDGRIVLLLADGVSVGPGDSYVGGVFVQAAPVVLKRRASLSVIASDAQAGDGDLSCDGTNDGEQIQTALASVGRVQLSDGVFRLRRALDITGDVGTLTGAGPGFHAGQAAQPAIGTRITTAPGFADTAIIRIQQRQDTKPVFGATVSNLVIDGAGATADGILCRSHNALLDRVFVFRCQNGIRLLGYPTWTTYNTHLRQCHTGFNAGAGILFDGFSTDGHVVHCITYQNKDGLVIEAGAGSHQITGLHTYDNADTGITMRGGSLTKLIGCKIENAGGHGLLLDGGMTGVIVTGCSFRLNGKAAHNSADHIHVRGTVGRSLFNDNIFLSVPAQSPNLPRYGVNLSVPGVQSLAVQNNVFGPASHFGTGPINNLGTGCVISGNVV